MHAMTPVPCLPPQDKPVLAPYAGEPGYSPRRRLAIMAGCSLLPWIGLLALLAR